jgi:nanoRNase/pAp phosphatase (c-di-AMP/oligoRNAs hydrolase)
MAAAFGLAAVARALGVDAEVYYAGRVGHPQVLLLWETFDLGRKARPFSEFERDMPVALVDSSKTRDARFGDVEFHPVMILDHHGESVRMLDSGRFWYVQPLGASCSVVADLAFRLGIRLDAETTTLLAIGIHSDTDGLTYLGTRPVDRYAYARLMDAGDQSLVSLAARFPMEEEDYVLLQTFMTFRKEYRGNVLVAHLPSPIEESKGDSLALAADFLARHKDARLVLTVAVVGGNVRVSARTRDPHFPLADVLRRLFGSGTGAKECSGGALCPIPKEGHESNVETWFADFLRDLEERLDDIDLPA